MSTPHCATSMLILMANGLKVLGLVLAKGPVSRLTVNNPNYTVVLKPCSI